jgi:hypothetical protein
MPKTTRRAMFGPMATDTKLANIASALGDPARANMMMALMDGRALTAKEFGLRRPRHAANGERSSREVA